MANPQGIRTDIQRIKAKALKAGMVRAFDNPRFDYFIDDVTHVKGDEIKIEHGNYTAADYLGLNDIVWIVV